jgi:carbon monoxide dehydrogenase subunit G
MQAMPILRERIETRLPLDDSFAFIADFANAARWDPGVATSERVTTGPDGVAAVGLGSRFRLGVRMGSRVAPMEYVITTFDPPHRVVLAGSGSGVVAVDDIRFAATPTGTAIDYEADIRLRGLLRFVEPFASRAFARIALNARNGMERTLDRLASDRGVSES